MSEFLLPDVGEGLTEAELVTWRVAVGDTVAVNDILCEIETAKSLVELPSPYAGDVSALLVAEGETVAVGTPIIRIGEMTLAEGRDDAPQPSSLPAEDAETAPVATLVGSGPKEMRASTRVLAKPGARATARAHDVDLSDVLPHRADGVIDVSDVERHVDSSGGSARPPAGVISAGVEPLRGVRKAMSEAMVASAAIPQVTIWTTVDATRTIELAQRLARDVPGVRLMTLIAKSVVIALGRHPLLNSAWTAEGVVTRDRINLGIAAATPRGLIVPHIEAADRLDLAGLQSALDDLIETARAGRTTPAAQAGGTFTITNIGPFGIEGGTPLLNPGESGILCLGAVVRRPWVVGDGVVPRDVVTLALTFDHRHVDGEAGARFLRDVARLVEDPGAALSY